MNGLDASISGKFINNNQLEIKFTNIREFGMGEYAIKMYSYVY